MLKNVIKNIDMASSLYLKLYYHNNNLLFHIEADCSLAFYIARNAVLPLYIILFLHQDELVFTLQASNGLQLHTTMFQKRSMVFLCPFLMLIESNWDLKTQLLGAFVYIYRELPYKS